MFSLIAWNCVPHTSKHYDKVNYCAQALDLVMGIALITLGTLILSGRIPLNFKYAAAVLPLGGFFATPVISTLFREVIVCLKPTK